MSITLGSEAKNENTLQTASKVFNMAKKSEQKGMHD
jgi:hypothetical protein